MITVRKVTRSLSAVMPRWPIVIGGVRLAIPLARLAALLFTAGLCLIQPARVRFDPVRVHRPSLTPEGWSGTGDQLVRSQ
jgi:hypothetical protein